MSAIIIDGKKVSEEIISEVKKNVSDLEQKYGAKPKLAVIIVGDNPASRIYVRNKEKKAYEAGFESVICAFSEKITREELLNAIEKLNNDPQITGILLQLPLPKHLCEKVFLDKIDPKKDVDGFNSINSGKLFHGTPENGAVPCTPKGIITLLDYYNIGLEGKTALVIGRSNIVGKPVSSLLLNRNATVIQAHSKTKNLKELTKIADVIISATGKQGILTGDMVKEGAVIIDVGIIRGEDGKLKGDVDFESAKDVASYITPVPGGVGPMTIASLMQNTLALFIAQRG